MACVEEDLKTFRVGKWMIRAWNREELCTIIEEATTLGLKSQRKKIQKQYLKKSRGHWVKFQTRKKGQIMFNDVLFTKCFLFLHHESLYRTLLIDSIDACWVTYTFLSKIGRTETFIKLSGPQTNHINFESMSSKNEWFFADSSDFVSLNTLVGTFIFVAKFSFGKINQLFNLNPSLNHCHPDFRK